MDESPRSPTHKVVVKTNKARIKMNQLLYGEELEDLTLDYLECTSFGDIYVFHELLGSGTYGVVISILEKSTGDEYAMKVQIYSTTL